LCTALCCGFAGAVLIFVLFVLLLLEKGSMPLSFIVHKSFYFVMVFAVMVIFGTIVQILFIRSRSGGTTHKKSPGKKWQLSEQSGVHVMGRRIYPRRRFYDRANPVHARR
jgi:hypothetical protein